MNYSLIYGPAVLNAVPEIPPNTAPEFKARMARLAESLYLAGWSVIGSLYKTPKLHPWKAPSKQELYELALANLSSGRANAINLRLSDTNTIALDLDIHDPDIARDIVAGIQYSLGLTDQTTFTCTGSKGCKIFFRTKGHESDLPREIGQTVYTQAGAKVQVEVKTTLSTVAGLHSEVEYPLEPGKYSDYVLYVPYVYSWPATPHKRRCCAFICATPPNRLPTITTAELQAISDTCSMVLCSYDCICQVKHNGVTKSRRMYKYGQFNRLVTAAAAWILRAVCVSGLPVTPQSIEQCLKEHIYSLIALGIFNPVHKALLAIAAGAGANNQQSQALCRMACSDKGWKVELLDSISTPFDSARSLLLQRIEARMICHIGLSKQRLPESEKELFELFQRCRFLEVRSPSKLKLLSMECESDYA